MIQVKWKDQEKETYAASKLCFVPVLVLLSVEKGGPVFGVEVDRDERIGCLRGEGLGEGSVVEDGRRKGDGNAVTRALALREDVGILGILDA
jgi:hypothetical protein